MKSDVDFERVAMLLSIPTQVAGVAPGMTYLSSAAMAELKEINDQLAAQAKEEIKAREEEAAKAVVAPQRKLSPGEPMPGDPTKVVVAGPDGEPVENTLAADDDEVDTVAEVEEENEVDLSGDGLVGTDNEDTQLNRLPVVDETPKSQSLKRKI